tara:strand:- start:2600 stop:3376 length:777 start_codon:yes stop_codon:yes gene_type:complete
MYKSNKKYNYKKFGKNCPLIIFIHGAGCDQTFWALLNRYYFFRGYSTLAINFPGHGDNMDKGLKTIDEMANYVKKIVKKYSSKENILVGHSMGSLVCLNVILNKLFDVSKAILIGIAVPMQVNSFLLNLSKENSADAILKMINWSLTDEAKLRGNQLIGLNLPNFINNLMNKTSNRTLFYDLNACNNYIVKEEDMRKIDIPCLIIVGKRDVMTPLKSAYKLCKLLKNSSIEILDSCGHFHIFEKSNEVREVISGYLEN